jgi:eukaryotic-like serine/threonine-protein kinase
VKRKSVHYLMTETTLLNNRYNLEGSIGSGGMARVYRARDLMLERTVAIKVLREDFSADPSFRERFRQEAMAAANLYHPNIVTIHDFGLDGGRFFIVMENVPGTDLKSILLKKGRFSLEDTLSLMVQACAGIGYAHRSGLVHCDIKPHNFLVTPDKRLKVADFGIARALATIRPDERSNVVWGSPQYFSPEQAAGAAPSPASDVYSLGVVMYEMLTGRLPFIGSTATELARMHRESAPIPPRSINSSIPRNLEQILLKILSKEPSARYRTADQLGRVLAAFQKPETAGIPGTDGAEREFSTRPASPVRETPPARTMPEKPLGARTDRQKKAVESPPVQDNPMDIDWGTWGLGLLALLAVGGLIPFLLWVFMSLRPTIP